MNDAATEEHLSANEASALRWIRRSMPDLSDDEQIEEARRIAAGLPTLREPKRTVGIDGRTMALRINDFVERLRHVPIGDRRRISGIVGREKRDLFETYQIRYVRSELTEFRAAVRAAFGPTHPAIGYLHLNKTDNAAVNEIYRSQVRQQRRALVPIDGDMLIDNAVAVLESPSSTVFALGVALTLLTGRRPIELFKFGAFEVLDRHHLLFRGNPDLGLASGQAKTKDAVTARTYAYPIPVHTSATVVHEAFLRMREMRDLTQETPTRVNSIVAKSMKEFLSKQAVLGNFVDAFGNQLTVKDLRAAYAEIAWGDFAPVTMTQDVYFHDILGHAETDDDSARSYMRFYVLGRIGDAQADNESAFRSLALNLYRLRDAETDPKTRGYLDERIASVEADLSFTGRAEVRRAAGREVDPAIAERARLVHSLVTSLSPAQERAVRRIANAVEPSVNLTGADRKPLELLEQRGIISLTSRDMLVYARLTPVGEEVRAALPRIGPALIEDDLEDEETAPTLAFADSTPG